MNKAELVEEVAGKVSLTKKEAGDVTDCLFPGGEEKATPHTEDSNFWKVEAEKFISSEERVEIEI